MNLCCASKMQIARGITEELIQRAQTEPVVILEGARATGKTTIAKHLVETGIYTSYRSLADETAYGAAKSSPADFISQLPFGTIIDEAQLVEDITVPIKTIIDDDGQPGRFLLTGSTRLRRTALGGSDPLAGRTLPPLPLHPLTMSERNGALSEPNVIDPSGSGRQIDHTNSFIDVLMNPTDLPTSTSIVRSQLTEFLTSGGMPGWFQSEDNEIRELRFEQYLRGTVSLPTFSGRDLALLESFYRYIAGNTASLVNFEKFSRSNQMQGATAKQYLSLLSESMLVVSLPGWRSERPKVELQRPKLHVFDTGAAVALGQLRPAEEPEDFGKLLETLVVTDLLAQASWASSKVEFYHWRHKQKNEIDLLIVDRNNRALCIEVKSSSTVNKDDFAHINRFRELYPKLFFRGVVFYTGQDAYKFGENQWAIPVGMACQTT